MGLAIHGFGSESGFVGSAFAFSKFAAAQVGLSDGEVVTRNVPQMVPVELGLSTKRLETA